MKYERLVLQQFRILARVYCSTGTGDTAGTGQGCIGGTSPAAGESGLDATPICQGGTGGLTTCNVGNTPGICTTHGPANSVLGLYGDCHDGNDTRCSNGPAVSP